MAAPADEGSGSDGDEQAAAPGMGRWMLLPRGVRVALAGGTGEGVVVAVGTRTRVAEDPAQRRSVGRAGEHAAVECRRQVVAGDLIDALRLPLPVGGTQAVGGVVLVA